MNPNKRVPPVDLERVFRCIGEERMVQSVLSSYPRHLEALLTDLQAAIDRGAQPEVHRIAHSIRGGALNLGAGLLGEAALGVERSASAGDLKGAASQLSGVMHEANRVSSYLRRVYKE